MTEVICRCTPTVRMCGEIEVTHGPIATCKEGCVDCGCVKVAASACD
ncbi:hypothetical protein [[Acholeplasma] multilocale]|nr:hypothetical protein [[Acholeplasma] multilocale]